MANPATQFNKNIGRQGVGGAMPANNSGANPAAPAPAAGMQARIRSFLDSDKRSRYRVVEHVRTGALEILPQLASQLNSGTEGYDVMNRAMSMAVERGTSFSQFLDEIDPSEQYNGELAQMDAFQRQLYFAGIRTKSVPEKGIYSDQIGRFFQSNIPGSQVLFPEFINRTMRETAIAPDILPYIVATTTGIDSDAYRTIYTNDQVGDRQMYRVEQGNELPKTVLKSAENVVRIYKYGRLLEGSYEYFRRIRIDTFSILLRRIGLQANLDKASTAIDVAVNGDGNSNPATNYNQSTLDTGTSPTYKGFLKFALNFYPYTLTTLVGGLDDFVAFLTMARPSVDPFQVINLLQQQYVVNQQIELPQQLYTNIQLVYLPNVLVAGTLLGLDRRFALERVIENGGNIVETDRLVQTQVNHIAISEAEGFAKIFKEATRTWTTNA